MIHEADWRLFLAVIISLVFVVVGLYAAVRPDTFVTRPLLWSQGDMERELNRSGVRVVGAMMVVGALWMRHDVLVGWL